MIGDYLRRADEAGLSWPLPEGMTEVDLDQALFPPDLDGSDDGGGNSCLSAGGCPEPDWGGAVRELRRKGVTRQHLWVEYRERHPDGYSYSRFCGRLRVWQGQTTTTIPQKHRAGERLFVDYAGQTVAIACAETGEVRQAQVFMATQGRRATRTPRSRGARSPKTFWPAMPGRSRSSAAFPSRWFQTI